MKTVLDVHQELQREGHRYDGNSLVAEVSDLVVGSGGKVSSGNSRYLVKFSRPIAHAVTEEFPAAVSNLVRGNDNGFLRIIENKDLTAAMGLDVESFRDVRVYALVTAHEVLVVYCCDEPEIETNSV